MAIKEQMWHVRARGLRLSDYIGWPGVLRSDASKPMSRNSATSHSAAGAIARIGRVGRNRGDFNQLEEPYQGQFEVSIDFRQNRVERGHRASLQTLAV